MKNLAKLTALTLTAALALTACGSTADSAAPADSTADTAATEETGGDLLSQIQANGTITVAMEGTWAPWTYHDESDNLVGYDVEVATKIAEKLGIVMPTRAGEQSSSSPSSRSECAMSSSEALANIVSFQM